METNYIYKGDCMEYMSMLADCSVDLVASDVPYRLKNRGGAWHKWWYVQEKVGE